EWVCRAFQMAEDLTDHLALRDDSDEPQRPALTPRTGSHLQVKDSPQEPGPSPIRGSRLRCRAVHPLLGQCRDDTPAEMAVRRQAPPIAHQVDVWQGD